MVSYIASGLLFTVISLIPLTNSAGGGTSSSGGTPPGWLASFGYVGENNVHMQRCSASTFQRMNNQINVYATSGHCLRQLMLPASRNRLSTVFAQTPYPYQFALEPYLERLYPQTEPVTDSDLVAVRVVYPAKLRNNTPLPRVPEVNLPSSPVTIDTVGTVAAWKESNGGHDYIHQTNAKVVNDGMCSRAWKQFRSGDMICIEGAADGSGSAFFVQDNSEDILYGIYRYSINNNIHAFINVYPHAQSLKQLKDGNENPF